MRVFEYAGAVVWLEVELAKASAGDGEGMASVSRSVNGGDAARVIVCELGARLCHEGQTGLQVAAVT